MAVKIRLTRRGRKKLALYDIIAADARVARDGRFIEKLGNYNPNTHPATIVLKEQKILQWLSYGAQPTRTVSNILSSQGILLRRHLQVGVNKEAITQEEANKRWEAWQQTRTTGSTKKGLKTNQEVKTEHLPQQSLDNQDKASNSHTQSQETPRPSPAGIKEEPLHDSATPPAPPKAQEPSHS